METIYTHAKTGISLCEDKYDTNNTPYIVKYGNKIKLRTDDFAMAYGVYNELIAKHTI